MLLLLSSAGQQGTTEGADVAKLYWAVCDICDFIGNSYEHATPANDELSQHMREHASRDESGGGRLEESD